MVFAIHRHESAMGVHVSPILNTPSYLPPHPIPQGHPSALALSTLYHASNLDWRCISHMVIYMFQCYSLKSFFKFYFGIQFSCRWFSLIFFLVLPFHTKEWGTKQLVGIAVWALPWTNWVLGGLETCLLMFLHATAQREGRWSPGCPPHARHLLGNCSKMERKVSLP